MATKRKTAPSIQRRASGVSAADMSAAINRAKDRAFVDNVMRPVVDQWSPARRAGPVPRILANTAAAARSRAVAYEVRSPSLTPKSAPRIWELSSGQRRMIARQFARGVWRRFLPDAFDIIDELWTLFEAPAPLSDVNNAAWVLNPGMEPAFECDGQSERWFDLGGYTKTNTTPQCYTLQAGTYGRWDLDLGSTPGHVHEMWWRHDPLWGGGIGPSRWRSGKVWYWAGRPEQVDQNVLVPVAPAVPPMNNGGLAPLARFTPVPRLSYRQAAGRVTDPYGVRGERNAVGPYAAPRRAGSQADYVIAADSLGQTVSPTPYAPPHKQEPPPSYEKERKLSVYSYAGGIGTAALAIVGAVGEAGDFLDALYDALPDEVKPKGSWFSARREYLPPSFTKRMTALYENWDKVDLNAAIDNLVINHYEDKLFGFFGEVAKRGINTRLQHSGFMTGPWDTAAPQVFVEE